MQTVLARGSSNCMGGGGAGSLCDALNDAREHKQHVVSEFQFDSFEFAKCLAH